MNESEPNVRKPSNGGLVRAAYEPVETGIRAEELGRLLERHRGERHIVALQDYPDPDAMSAALAYQMIAERFDITVSAHGAGRETIVFNLPRELRVA